MPNDYPDYLRTPAMMAHERHLGRPLREVLQERYDAGATQAELAEEFGVSQPVMSRWMARMGITARRRGPMAAAA